MARSVDGIKPFSNKKGGTSATAHEHRSAAPLAPGGRGYDANDAPQARTLKTGDARAAAANPPLAAPKISRALPDRHSGQAVDVALLRRECQARGLKGKAVQAVANGVRAVASGASIPAAEVQRRFLALLDATGAARFELALDGLEAAAVLAERDAARFGAHVGALGREITTQGPELGYEALADFVVAALAAGGAAKPGHGLAVPTA
ncbi:MAG: hypothetical protein HY903_11605 [Deltaproteobacteria bacterium]|nr:hypothetical protein [Deltaproteobacteria bacterium]